MEKKETGKEFLLIVEADEDVIGEIWCDHVVFILFLRVCFMSELCCMCLSSCLFLPRSHITCIFCFVLIENPSGRNDILHILSCWNNFGSNSNWCKDCALYSDEPTAIYHCRASQLLIDLVSTFSRQHCSVRILTPPSTTQQWAKVSNFLVQHLAAKEPDSW